MALSVEALVVSFVEIIVSQLKRELAPMLLEATKGQHQVRELYAEAAKVRPVRASKNGKKGYTRDMRCRIHGCMNRSKGPRFGYFCEKHVTLSKAEKKKAALEYKQHRNAA
jgi:hypothetical protein